MASYSRLSLQNTTGGGDLGIVVTGLNPTLGVNVHVGPAGASKYDEVYLWAQCHVTKASLFYVWVNGATAAVAGTRRIKCETTGADHKGLLYVVPGFKVNGAASVRAFTNAASGENDWTVFGYVNRYAT